MVKVEHPITQHLLDLFRNAKGSVVMLSGHAGDGKSTIALDLFKTSQGLTNDEILKKPMEAIQETSLAGLPLFIVKDMSEATAEQRISIFNKALSDKGNWLIVTNTGPLLSTASSYHERSSESDTTKLEDAILAALDSPVTTRIDNTHKLTQFDKPVYIVNLTRIDNLFLLRNFLQNVYSSPVWSTCLSCPALKSCPIRQNIEELSKDHTVVERIYWLYRFLTAYACRIPARQMTAHLSFAITGGLSCEGIKERAESTKLETGDYLLSNTLFGFKGTEERRDASGLNVINLLKPYRFGVKPFARLERLLSEETLSQLGLSEPIVKTALALLAKAESLSPAQGTPFRQELRRLLYLFGRFESNLDPFIDVFLGSQKLRMYERIVRDGMTALDRRQIMDKALPALLEAYTSFPSVSLAGGGGANQIYLTLKREEFALPQFVQRISSQFSFADFNVKFDSATQHIVLEYLHGNDEICLPLPLTMLDFMEARSKGELCGVLEMDYLNRLKAFKSKLLAAGRKRNDEDYGGSADEFRFLQSAVTGQLYRVNCNLIKDKVDVKYED